MNIVSQLYLSSVYENEVFSFRLFVIGLKNRVLQERGASSNKDLISGVKAPFEPIWPLPVFSLSIASFSKASKSNCFSSIINNL